jgi:uncharacterized membrane protein
MYEGMAFQASPHPERENCECSTSYSTLTAVAMVQKNFWSVTIYTPHDWTQLGDTRSSNETAVRVEPIVRAPVTVDVNGSRSSKQL